MKYTERTQLTLRQIQTIVAASETLNYAATAQKMGVSTSTVIKAVKAAENVTGKLFDAVSFQGGTDTIKPTDQCKRLVKAATPLVKFLANIPEFVAVQAATKKSHQERNTPKRKGKNENQNQRRA